METYINLDQTYFERPQELTDLVNTTKLVQKIFTKTSGHRHNTRCNQKKGLDRHTFAPYHQRNTSRLFNQPSFQRYIQILGSKHLTKEKACKAKGRKPIRQICPIRFMLFKINPMPRKEKALLAFAYNTFNTPNLCNHSPFELIFRRQPRILQHLETDPNIKVLVHIRTTAHCLTKGYIIYKCATKLPNQMSSPNKPGQRIFSI